MPDSTRFFVLEAAFYDETENWDIISVEEIEEFVEEDFVAVIEAGAKVRFTVLSIALIIGFLLIIKLVLPVIQFFLPKITSPWK